MFERRNFKKLSFAGRFISLVCIFVLVPGAGDVLQADPVDLAAWKADIQDKERRIDQLTLPETPSAPPSDAWEKIASP